MQPVCLQRDVSRYQDLGLTNAIPKSNITGLLISRSTLIDLNTCKLNEVWKFQLEIHRTVRRSTIYLMPTDFRMPGHRWQWKLLETELAKCSSTRLNVSFTQFSKSVSVDASQWDHRWSNLSKLHKVMNASTTNDATPTQSEKCWNILTTFKPL